MSSSAYLEYEKKYILILAKGSTQVLDDTRLTAEAKYLLNLHNQEKDLY